MSLGIPIFGVPPPGKTTGLAQAMYSKMANAELSGRGKNAQIGQIDDLGDFVRRLKTQ